MFKRDASRFVRIGNTLQAFYSNYVADTLPDAWMSDVQCENFIKELGEMRADCESMALFWTWATVDCCVSAYTASSHTQRQLRATIQHLNETACST